jgi:threonylcarbamoyladenosine tRNA methylthiotransferase MtaB
MTDKTFCIKTLGCKLNQYESALIAQRFLSRGWQAIDFGETADAVIINTCTVTDRSDKKCRNLIRQAARFSRTGAVIVTGCLVESSQKELERMGCILACFPNSAKDSIVHYAEQLLEGISSAKPADDVNTPLPFLRTRGYVKVQDGCDQHCSYCIVPSVRGSARSRPLREVLAHVHALIEAQCPEIVLTGITIGNYRDGDIDIAKLVETIVQCVGNFRLRITSIEPMHVSDALIEMLAHPKVCPHLHLPLQSGSDRILSRSAQISLWDFPRKPKAISPIHWPWWGMLAFPMYTNSPSPRAKTPPLR